MSVPREDSRASELGEDPTKSQGPSVYQSAGSELGHRHLAARETEAGHPGVRVLIC